MDVTKRSGRPRQLNSEKKSEPSSDLSVPRRSSLNRFRLKMRMMSGVSKSSTLTFHPIREQVSLENTYRLEPAAGNRFCKMKADEMLRGVLEAYLSDLEYDAERLPSLSKTLADLLKERVKGMGLERYKVVSTVTITEANGQGMRVASRCLWNQTHDNYASVSFEGKGFFAVASVYAFYFE